ncbi:MAG: DUF2723 domain-containing protein [Fibromonadales bacterium]|nr:DUF2723 domain-containing protein [Fibromonadales bacterium]
MTDRLCKHLTAGFAGLIAFITYAITMAPTVSFWDCGEFIASANTLGIPHPPGTPFFVFFARVVIVMLPMVEEIAKRVNYISVFTSAATVYVIVLFCWDLLAKLSKNVSRFILTAASLCAGFLLMFSDTFWFNAVEAEVYGFAMFIVMLVSYLALLYLDNKNDRYLVFICYLAFLGIGVHLYTLMTIPAIFILLLFADGKPLKTLVEKWPLWITGTVLLSAVYAISSFITWSVILMLVLLVAWLATRNKNIGLSLAFTVVALIGFSTHLYIPIRSELNPIIDENDPEINFRDDNGKLILKNFNPTGKNWRAFYDYLERKQYGSESMISRAFYRRAQLDNQILVFPHMSYGGYQIAQYSPFKVGQVSYYQKGYYSIDPDGNEPLVRGSLKFPTLMMSIGENELAQAAIFLLFNGLLVWIIFISFKRSRAIGIYLALLYGLCSAGLIWYINFSDGTKPERRDHRAWVGQMEEITRELSNKGMMTVSRIPDPNELLNIQRMILKDHSNGAKPSKHEQNPAWQNWAKIQAAIRSVGWPASLASLPDPVHLEVRDRDYFYSPAFIFMSLLYGLGIGLLLLSIAQRKESLLKPSGIAVVLLCGAVPLFANYKEHNRANLWVPWDYAYNLLMSCEPNAILFTNGDNDTFPLWFAQEVAGIRKDVRVVNLSLGNTDWYIKQILDNPPVLKLSYDKAGIDREFALNENNFNHASQKIDYWVNLAEERIPKFTKQIENLNARLGYAETAADSAEINAAMDKLKPYLQIFTALKEWGTPRRGGIMQTQYKLVIDLALNNLDKPLHVSTTVGLSNAVGLDKYMVQKGMVWDLVKGTLAPVRKDSIDVERTAHLIDNVFKFRGLGDGTAYIDEETRQLLLIYNNIYSRLAIAINDTERGLRYVDLGIKQFPEEWRNYLAAAELLRMSGNKAKAIEYLEKGLEEVSAGFGSQYLRQTLEALKGKE